MLTAAEKNKSEENICQNNSFLLELNLTCAEIENCSLPLRISGNCFFLCLVQLWVFLLFCMEEYVKIEMKSILSTWKRAQRSRVSKRCFRLYSKMNVGYFEPILMKNWIEVGRKQDIITIRSEQLVLTDQFCSRKLSMSNMVDCKQFKTPERHLWIQPIFCYFFISKRLFSF